LQGRELPCAPQTCGQQGTHHRRGTSETCTSQAVVQVKLVTCSVLASEPTMPARHEQCPHTQARCNRQLPTRQHASCSDIYRAARLSTHAGSAHAIAHVQRAHGADQFTCSMLQRGLGYSTALHSSLARPGRRTACRRARTAQALSSAESAELPAVAAVDARDERGHRLVRAARLHLVVLALALPALAALELVSRRGLHVLPALRLRERGPAYGAVGRAALVAGQLLGRQLHQQRACGRAGGGRGGLRGCQRRAAARSRWRQPPGRASACSAPIAPAGAAAAAAPPGTAPGPEASSRYMQARVQSARADCT